MAQACNLSTWETEAERSEVQGQPGLQEILSQQASRTKTKIFRLV